MVKQYSKEEIAQILYIVIKSINDCIGEETKPFNYEDLAQNIFDITDSTQPQDNHNRWMKHRLQDGWVYGHIKDVEKKITPYLVSYKQLPQVTRIKDHIAVELVKELWLKQQ